MKNGRVYLILVALSIFLIASPALSQPTARITSPADGARVNHRISVSGTCQHVTSGRFLWLVVQPVGDTSFHPQSGSSQSRAISNGCNGTWNGVAYIGENQSNNIGEEFDILLVDADRNGNLAMQNYLINARNTRVYSGLQPLPAGVNVLHKIRVIRR